ncbi:hypothetical protein ABH935_007708 [Catenulispora sp. GAS73]|uniref:hypothetical protein n=1 Tax=Catenulispora sp. GAS73 TaxID=3156269 RepID=UPI00351146B5
MTGNNQRSGGRMRRRFVTIAAALAVCLSFLAAPIAYAAEEPSTTQLTLVNGWSDAPYGTEHAGVRQLSDGVVVFTGAIRGGTTGVAFTLPANDRPTMNEYVPVDMCNATKGRLVIQTSGVVTVQAEGAFSNASCFTSLDGASFLISAASGLPVTLQNGWSGGPYGTAQPAVQIKSSYYTGGSNQGTVHFVGAISGGANGSVAFTLPVGYRPSTTKYVPVDMCGATNGRLIIHTDGTVVVQQESSTSTNANCFTSLDGAWFVLNTTPNYLSLTLQNGWYGAGYGTAAPGIDEDYDGLTYQFSGAIATSSANTNSVVFTLPYPFSPGYDVYIPVDLCNATNGRLHIQANGVTTVEAETVFSNATCFTSLDGVSYSRWQHLIG